MPRWKKILLVLALLPLLLASSCVAIVGPWPAYKDSRFESSNYYRQAREDLGALAAACDYTPDPQPFKAGWAERDITPKTGVPLAGYSARPNGKISEGVHDPLHVRAIALSDGRDTVVIAGADMLIIPPNIAEMVRARVRQRTPLDPSHLLFNASHTHCGPGGFAPGIAARITGGKYDPEVPEFIADRFADAIVEAYERMAPARAAHGGVDAPEFIRNRVRDAPVDPELSFLVVEQDDGERCYVMSYNAHPTILGDEFMRFSAEYPGVLAREIAAATGAGVVYLGGAVGSCGPRAPEAAADFDRVEKMGKALAALVLEHTQSLTFSDRLQVASAGSAIGMPPMQMRPFENHPNWRMSPLFARLLGVPNEGWIHGARAGDVLFVGLPCDFSGEISIDWKAWAKARNIDLWPLSFCSAYCGYFSPDRYYRDLPLSYETGLMSWYGPNIEAYMTGLFHHLAGALWPAPDPA